MTVQKNPLKPKDESENYKDQTKEKEQPFSIETARQQISSIITRLKTLNDERKVLAIGKLEGALQKLK